VRAASTRLCVSETTSDERVEMPLPVPERIPEDYRRRRLRSARRRNKQLEQENEILRRATAYFARDTASKARAARTCK
jgi:transposase-like protein